MLKKYNSLEYKTEINSLEGDYSLENIDIMLSKNISNAGIYYLILKYMCNSESFEYYDYVNNILNLLIIQKDIKWRHFNISLPYLKKFISEEEFDKYYMVSVLPNIIVCENMILDLAKIDKNMIKYYIGSYIISDNIYQDYPITYPTINYSILLDNMEKFIKKKYSQKGLDRFLKIIPSKKYDIVFDGNNILLNKAGNLDQSSYNKLYKLYQYCLNNKLKPLVFIHSRIIKLMKKNNMKLDFNFIATPYRYNDDWFCLYYAIKNNIKLVSRDIYRDHINQFDSQKGLNYMKIFLSSNKLNITEDFSSIIFDNNILPIIIKNNDSYFIPGKKGYFKI